MTNSQMIKNIFRDCRINMGIGSPDAHIVVIYAFPGRRSIFPSGEYLQNLCQHFEINKDDLYITPIVKDRNLKKPLITYVDLLINELAIVKPKVAWIVGQEPLILLGTKDISSFYRHVFGMYFPILVRDFYGFLLVAEKELGQMPKEVKEEFLKRMQVAAEDVKNLDKKDGPYFRPDEKQRGDIYMVDLMLKHTDLRVDKDLDGENTFIPIWSDKIGDYIFLCKNDKVRNEVLKLGFGIVLTQNEVGKLNRRDADFVAETLKVFRARKFEEKR